MSVTYCLNGERIFMMGQCRENWIDIQHSQSIPEMWNNFACALNSQCKLNQYSAYNFYSYRMNVETTMHIWS